MTRQYRELVTYYTMHHWHSGNDTVPVCISSLELDLARRLLRDVGKWGIDDGSEGVHGESVYGEKTTNCVATNISSYNLLLQATF